MKKKIKNSFKIIVSFIVGGILFSGVTVYATNYLAKNITYKNTNVEDALNELYKSKSYTSPDKIEKIIDEYIFEEDYSLCFLASARNKADNVLKLNDEIISPDMYYYDSSRAVRLMTHVFKNIKKGDKINAISLGSLECWY